MLPKSLMLLGAATTGIGVLVITKLVLKKRKLISGSGSGSLISRIL